MTGSVEHVRRSFLSSSVASLCLLGLALTSGCSAPQGSPAPGHVPVQVSVSIPPSRTAAATVPASWVDRILAKLDAWFPGEATAWAVSPSEVVNLRISVTAPDISPAQQLALIDIPASARVSGGSVSATVEVPSGSSRTLLFAALNAAGGVIYTGSVALPTLTSGSPVTNLEPVTLTAVGGGPSITISGFAVKGPFQPGATVRATDMNDSTRATSGTITTAQGAYQVTVTWTGPTLIEVSGPYVDEFTGSTREHAAGTPLRAAVNVSSSAPSMTSHVNIATSMAAQVIQNNAVAGTAIAASQVTNANATVAQRILGSSTTGDITQINLHNTADTDAGRLLAFHLAVIASAGPANMAAAITQLAENVQTGQTLGSAPASGTSALTATNLQTALSEISNGGPVNVAGVGTVSLATALSNTGTGWAPTNFSLTAGPALISVLPGGGTATTTLTAALVSGLPTTVSLSVSGCPSGTTCSLSSSSVSLTGTSTLTVTTTASTPPGNFTLTVTGTGGGVTRTTTVPVVEKLLAISTVPANGALNVSPATTVQVSFSKAVDLSSFIAHAVLSGPGGPVAGTSICDSTCTTVTFTPAGLLAQNSTFTLTMPTTVLATDGGPLSGVITASFSTAGSSLTVNPTGATISAGSTTTATVTFTLGPSTNGTTVTLAITGGCPVDVTCTVNPTTLSPTTGGSATSTLTIVTTTGTLPRAATIALATSGGTAPPGATSYALTVGGTATSGGIVFPPTVAVTSPLNGATGVAVTSTVSATFSTAMDPTTINTNTFVLADDHGFVVPATVSYDGGGNTATLNAGVLAAGRTYSVQVTTAAKDSTGVPLASDVVWSFTTSNTLPTVTTLATDSNPLVFANNTTDVYYSTSGATATGAVKKVSKAGGSAVMLAGGLTSPSGGPNIAHGVDTTNVYFSEVRSSPNGTVRKAAVDGSQGATTGTLLASGLTLPVVFGVDSSFAYFREIATGTGTIGKVPVSGTGPFIPITLASGLNSPASAPHLLDSTHVYFSDATSGIVGKALLDGSQGSTTGTTLASGQTSPSIFWMDSSFVYFRESTSGTGTIKKVPIGGGAVVTLAAGLNQPLSQPHLVDSTHVYFSEQAGSVVGAGTVKKVTIDGSQVTTLASGLTNPLIFAMDGGFVYFRESSSTVNAIKKVPQGGGRVVTLATGLPGLTVPSHTIDGTHVYFAYGTLTNTTTVAKVPK